MKRHGLTLVELLVVISVIALLISLSLRALRVSRMQAKAVLCQSNVRQLTVALFMYADEHETFPHGFRRTHSESHDYLGSASADPRGLWWLNDIKDFATKADSEERVFYCPSRRLDSPSLRRNILWGNYGVNQSICRTFPPSRLHKREFTGTPLGRDSMRHPSQTLLIVDSGHSLINWWYVTDIAPQPLESLPEDLSYVPGLDINAGRDLLPAQQGDAIRGRHPNKTVNVGFADGQVSLKKAQDLFVESTSEEYRNRTPLWTPE